MKINQALKFVLEIIHNVAIHILPLIQFLKATLEYTCVQPYAK